MLASLQQDLRGAYNEFRNIKIALDFISELLPDYLSMENLPSSYFNTDGTINVDEFSKAANTFLEKEKSFFKRIKLNFVKEVVPVFKVFDYSSSLLH